MTIEESYEVVAGIVRKAYDQVVVAYPPTDRPSNFKFTLEPEDKQIYVDIVVDQGDGGPGLKHQVIVWVTEDNKNIRIESVVKYLAGAIYNDGGKFTLTIPAGRHLVSTEKSAVFQMDKWLQQNYTGTDSNKEHCIEIMDYWADSLQEAFNAYIKDMSGKISDEDIPSKFFDIL